MGFGPSCYLYDPSHLEVRSNALPAIVNMWRDKTLVYGLTSEIRRPRNTRHCVFDHTCKLRFVYTSSPSCGDLCHNVHRQGTRLTGRRQEPGRPRSPWHLIISQMRTGRSTWRGACAGETANSVYVASALSSSSSLGSIVNFALYLQFLSQLVQ